MTSPLTARILLLALLAARLVLRTGASYRLPDALVPTHYRLEIIANLGDDGDSFDFHGDVWIKTKCLHPTTNVTLHAKKLDVDESRARVLDLTSPNRSLTIKGFERDVHNDFLTAQLDSGLLVDHEYEVRLPFAGKLEDVLAGFYRSSYEDKATNTTRYLATTQFESTDARRAFPCFDEPDKKATFEISVGHAEKYSAIGNMPAVKTEPMDNKKGWVWTRFERTVPMSTYLVAFIVSDFAYETAPPSKDSNVTFRIWSRKDALGQVKFARDVGPKFLDYYEKFFDIKYPLPKQDMVAIPDFAAGAMENWGLITYREAYLLYDPQVSAVTSQEPLASVIAHELAHQWFGNLVTMKWWTDLWLNEGFATYMAALAVHHVFPEWNSLEEESVENLIAVFGFDSLRSSHPISVPVGHPSEIDQIFDTISYKKGSQILRMMSLFLGEDTLRKGVSKYLQEHKYGNAEQDDLWLSLTKQAHDDRVLPQNLTVKKIMDTWTLQTGYPVVSVDREYGKGSIKLRQKRFLLDTKKTTDTRTDECWWVPISYTDETEANFNDTRPKHWLPCTRETDVVHGFDHDDKWVIFNVQAAGLYRINYDETNWNMLVKAMNTDDFDRIPVINRVQLLSDSAYLSWIGDLDYKVFFELFKYLTREDKYLPWSAALSNMAVINRQMKRSGNYGTFKKYMRNILTPVYEKIDGVKVDKKLSRKLEVVKHQSQIVGWSCKFDASSCVEDAREKFADYTKNPDDLDIIPRDLRSAIYCNALRHGGEDEWNFLWGKYTRSNVASEKSSILGALGCTREIWLLKRYLEWSIKPDSGIRKQDQSSVFGAVANNDVGFFIAQNFLEENIGKIHDNLAPNTRRLSRYLNPLAMQMTTEAELAWFRNFTESNEERLKDAKQGVDQSLERIRLNIQWQKKHSDHINKFFEKCEGINDIKKTQ